MRLPFSPSQFTSSVCLSVCLSIASASALSLKCWNCAENMASRQEREREWEKVRACMQGKWSRERRGRGGGTNRLHPSPHGATASLAALRCCCQTIGRTPLLPPPTVVPSSSSSSLSSPAMRGRLTLVFYFSKPRSLSLFVLLCESPYCTLTHRLPHMHDTF